MRLARSGAGTFCFVFGLIVVALARCTNAQLAESPAPFDAQTRENPPIADEDRHESENIDVDEDLSVAEKKLFKTLFIKRRKEHLEAVKNLKRMDNYERQYKMVNLIVEKMFDVIESKRALLDNITESDLMNPPFTAPDSRNILKYAMSNVLDVIAFFGDVLLNLPDITERILKTQPKWNSTVIWSLHFINKSKDWLDESTIEMVKLAHQELKLTPREPGYFNPNRIAHSKSSNQSGSKKKASSKKQKQQRGPTMTKIEL